MLIFKTATEKKLKFLIWGDHPPGQKGLQQAWAKEFMTIPVSVGDFLPGTPLGGLTW